ncbi:MAG: bifunctional oligoribonuclease/PAP phosphatase NrnA [Candidatus Peregrinibacteria bacterium]
MRNLIGKANNVLIISHRKPDADTLGAGIAFKILLKKWGKNVTLACIDKPKKMFSFLPFVDEYVKEFLLESYDLMIIVDSGASYMTDFHLKHKNLFVGDIPIINIDHHASNDNYGEVNIVKPEKASTTMILYEMFLEWGIDIDVEMATCLLAGIYGDTGSFMHTNTNKGVYRVAGELMEKGASVAEINRNLFKSNSITTLKLWGKVLENVYVTPEKVVMSVVRDEDYKDAGANPEELSGVIDYLNMVPESKFAVLINEDRQGNVKGSFRTRNEEVDLSRIAAVFGGGGHPKASGFSIKGKLEEEVRYTIVSEDKSKKSLDF